MSARLPFHRSETAPEFVDCHDCGKPTTVTVAVLKAHKGDYVLCPACTSRTTVDP